MTELNRPRSVAPIARQPKAQQDSVLYFELKESLYKGTRADAYIIQHTHSINGWKRLEDRLIVVQDIWDCGTFCGHGIDDPLNPERNGPGTGVHGKAYGNPEGGTLYAGESITNDWFFVPQYMQTPAKSISFRWVGTQPDGSNAVTLSGYQGGYTPGNVVVNVGLASIDVDDTGWAILDPTDLSYGLVFLNKWAHVH